MFKSPVFGISQSALWTFFLPQWGKVYLPLEGREVLLHFGGCQTQDNSGQSSPQTRFLKNKIIFCKKYSLSSMYNDIFIVLYAWIRTCMTSYLLSLYMVIGLIESNHCLLRCQRQRLLLDYSVFFVCFPHSAKIYFIQDTFGDVPCSLFYINLLGFFIY